MPNQFNNQYEKETALFTISTIVNTLSKHYNISKAEIMHMLNNDLNDVEEDTVVGWGVYLIETGPQKLNVVKIIKDYCKDISLKEAKDIADNPNSEVAIKAYPVSDPTCKDEACAFRDQLLECGARAKVYPIYSNNKSLSK